MTNRKNVVFRNFARLCPFTALSGEEDRYRLSMYVPSQESPIVIDRDKTRGIRAESVGDIPGFHTSNVRFENFTELHIL